MDADTALQSYAKAITQALDKAGLPANKSTIIGMLYVATVMAPAVGISHQQMSAVLVGLAEELRKVPAEASDPFATMPVPKVIH